MFVIQLCVCYKLSFFKESDEGYLRIYLRGRPVSLYAPTELSDFTVDKDVTPPDQKLQIPNENLTSQEIY
jgi:hypothetical protein